MCHVEALCFNLSEFPDTNLYLDCGTAFSDKVTRFLIENLSNFTQLKHLELFSLGIENDAFVEITKFSHLEYFGLPCDTQDKHLEHLKHSTNLKSINASGTKIKGPGLIHLADLPDLHTLDLRYTVLEKNAFINLIHCKSIVTLLLSGSNITDADLEILTPMKSLKYLTLHNTALTDKCLQTLQGMENLEYVSLYDTQITESALRQLQQNRPDLKIVNARPQDYSQFWNIRSRACGYSGNTLVQYNLAHYYFRGLGPKDLIESLKWYIICSAKIDDLADNLEMHKNYEKRISDAIVKLKEEMTESQISEAQLRAKAYEYLQQKVTYDFNIDRQEGLPLYQYGFYIH